jgi:hypothetical protein
VTEIKVAVNDSSLKRSPVDREHKNKAVAALRAS